MHILSMVCLIQGGVLSHQEMARIPLVLLLVDMGLREQVEGLIRDGSCSWMEGRRYVIQEARLDS